MSNVYLVIAAILALIAAGWAYFYNKKGVKSYGPLLMLHTKKGIGHINKVAGISPLFWKIFATIGVITGFFFMINASYGLYKSAAYVLQTPKAAAAVALVLPGMKIMGISIPVFGWIFGVLTLLVVHEFSHGIIARAEKIKVKTVGAVLLGFLPIGAFVNPDEKQLRNEKTIKQLRIFAAGSFSNILLSVILVAVLIFAVLPMATSAVNGVKLTEVDKNAPAYASGLREGMTITSVEGQRVRDFISFSAIWISKNYKAGEVVNFGTDKGNFEVKLADRGDGNGKIGIVFCGKGIEKMNYPLQFFAPFLLLAPQQACQALGTTSALFWLGYELLLWAAIINFGVGIVNLLPIKPLDGGLMMEAVVKKFVRKPTIAQKIVISISLLFFLLLLANIFGPQLRTLLNFL